MEYGCAELHSAMMSGCHSAGAPVMLPPAKCANLGDSRPRRQRILSMRDKPNYRAAFWYGLPILYNRASTLTWETIIMKSTTLPLNPRYLIAVAVGLALLAFALGWVGSTQAQGEFYNILLTAPLEKTYSGDTPVLTSDVIGGCINQADCANAAGVDLDAALQSISTAIDANNAAIDAIDVFTLPPGAVDQACLAWSDTSAALVWKTC